jgi:hypothetical protein
MNSQAVVTYIHSAPSSPSFVADEEKLSEKDVDPRAIAFDLSRMRQAIWSGMRRPIRPV